MIRAAAVSLASLAAIDFWMFDGAYTHLVRRVAASIARHMW
jgi:hypothetical protein